MFALVKLLRDNALAGSVDVSVFGVSFGTRSLQEIMVVAVGLALIAAALLVGGSLALRALRRRRREQQRARVSSLETTERLLGDRVELLLPQVRELEERRAAFGGELVAERTAPAQVGDVVVIPDVPLSPEPGLPERLGHFRFDEARRR